VHGAHLGFHLPFGHLFAGHTPDRIIGDEKFTNVANEVLQFLSGDPNAKLTPKQMNELIDAIVKQCGKKADKLKITRPPTGGGGGDGGGGGGGFGGYPWWWYSMWNFVNWVNSITVSGPKQNL